MKIEIPQLSLEFTVGAEHQGVNLLAFLASRKVPIPRSCGGEGVCGTCRVWISGEGVPPETEFEKKTKSRHNIVDKNSSQKCRLACLVNLPSSSSLAMSKKWVISSSSW